MLHKIELGMGLGNLFNVGKPLARKLLLQAPTVDTLYKHAMAWLLPSATCGIGYGS